VSVGPSVLVPLQEPFSQPTTFPSPAKNPGGILAPESGQYGLHLPSAFLDFPLNAFLAKCYAPDLRGPRILAVTRGRGWHRAQ
jgi:hypothetical protein